MLDKFKNLFAWSEEGYEDDDYEYEDDQDYQTIYEEENTAASAPRPATIQRPAMRDRSHFTAETNMGAPRSNVIGMPGIATGSTEVVVIEPRSFEEMPQVIQALRERRSVVLNLNMMDPDEAQRSVDFIAGGTYAIDGHQERVGESIFLFTPSCVQVITPGGNPQEVPHITPMAPRPAAPTPTWSNDVQPAIAIQ